MNRHDRFSLSQGRADEIREMVEIGRARKCIKWRPVQPIPALLHPTSGQPSVGFFLGAARSDRAALAGEIEMEERQLVVGCLRTEVLRQHFRVASHTGALGDRCLNIDADPHAAEHSRTSAESQT